MPAQEAVPEDALLEPASEQMDPNGALAARPWAFSFYLAWGSTRTFAETITLRYDNSREVLYVAELAYQLPLDTGVSRFFQNVGAVFGVASNIAIRHEQRPGRVNPEFNVYASLRWRDLPWNRTIATTFAAGYGLSYASQVPVIEYETARSGEPRKFMNFLMVEVTVAPPSAPQTQLLLRVHHRSGTMGLMGPKRAGSNAIALGLRIHP